MDVMHYSQKSRAFAVLFVPKGRPVIAGRALRLKRHFLIVILASTETAMTPSCRWQHDDVHFDPEEFYNERRDGLDDLDEHIPDDEDEYDEGGEDECEEYGEYDEEEEDGEYDDNENYEDDIDF